MTILTMSRKQVDKLVEIVTHFHEVEFFTVETDDAVNPDGGMTVAFQLFADSLEEDTTINISDSGLE